MKTIRLIALFLSIIFVSNTAFSQAFGGKGGKNLKIGLGMAANHSWFPYDSEGPEGIYRTFTGVLNTEIEFGIGKYIGIGGYAGLEFGTIGSTGYQVFQIPLGVVANFHFYQLIADKSSSNILADKFDIYLGGNLGTGLSIGFSSNYNDAGLVVSGGPTLGLTYYPKSNLGVFAEFGYGKTFFNLGVSLKL